MGAGLLVGGGLLISALTGAPGASEPEPEVCETTVYEGCPARWDYLLEGS